MPIYLPRLTMVLAGLAALGAALTVLPNALIYLSIGTILSLVWLIWKQAQNGLKLAALVPILFFSYAQFRTPSPSVQDLSLYAGRHVIFSAQLVSELSYIGNGRWRAIIAPYQMLFPEGHRLIGKAQLILQQQSSHEPPTLVLKDNIEINAAISLPKRQEQPWQFDVAAYLKKQSIFCCATVYSTQLKKIDREQPLSDFPITCQRIIDVVRSKIVKAHTNNLGDKAGTLLSSMVLGDKTIEVDPTIVSDFRNVGLSHLIAASGFNLAVVATASFWLARCIYPARLFVTVLTLLNMSLFVAFAGLSPSVMRAMIMCIVLIASTHFHRSVNSLAAVGLALLITILIDPASIRDPGCELSFSATIGIICGAKYLSEILAFGTQLSEDIPPRQNELTIDDPHKKFLPILLAKVSSFVVETLSVVVCAQAAIMPVQLVYFWRIGLLFLPANLIVAPLVTPVTLLGFASSILAPLSSSGKVNAWSSCCWFLDMLTVLPLKTILNASSYLASVKEALINCGPPGLLSICFYYLCLSALLVSMKIKRRRKFCLLLFLLAAVILFWRPVGPQLTIGLLGRTTIVVNAEHQGFYIGERSAYVEKYLAYHGVQVGSASGTKVELQTGAGRENFAEYTLKSGSKFYSVLMPMPKTMTQSESGTMSNKKNADGYSFKKENFEAISTGPDKIRILVIKLSRNLFREKGMRRDDTDYMRRQPDLTSPAKSDRLLFETALERIRELQKSCGAKWVVLVGGGRQSVTRYLEHDQSQSRELKLITDRNLNACVVSSLADE